MGFKLVLFHHILHSSDWCSKNTPVYFVPDFTTGNRGIIWECYFSEKANISSLCMCSSYHLIAYVTYIFIKNFLSFSLYRRIVEIRWIIFAFLILQIWQFSTSEPIFSSPCTSASEQEVFFGSHDCFIYCCSMKGHLQWKFETTSQVYATPFAFRSQFCSNEMLLAAASTDGKLWILESKSGRLQSVYELPGQVFSSPVVWESMVLIGCRNNYVYCLDLLGGYQIWSSTVLIQLSEMFENILSL